MTITEWYAAYLLRFGMDTLFNVDLQEGEREFLHEMGKDIKVQNPDSIDSAWVILKEQHQRQLRRQREDRNSRHDQTV